MTGEVTVALVGVTGTVGAALIAGLAHIKATLGHKNGQGPAMQILETLADDMRDVRDRMVRVETEVVGHIRQHEQDALIEATRRRRVSTRGA